MTHPCEPPYPSCQNNVTLSLGYQYHGLTHEVELVERSRLFKRSFSKTLHGLHSKLPRLEFDRSVHEEEAPFNDVPFPLNLYAVGSPLDDVEVVESPEKLWKAINAALKDTYVIVENPVRQLCSLNTERCCWEWSGVASVMAGDPLKSLTLSETVTSYAAAGGQLPTGIEALRDLPVLLSVSYGFTMRDGHLEKIEQKWKELSKEARAKIMEQIPE